MLLERYTVTFNPAVNRWQWNNGVQVPAAKSTRTYLGRTWYQRHGTASSASPGHSNHGTGSANDWAQRDASGKSISLTRAGFEWLAKNGPRFGWYWTVDSESWHWCHIPGDAVTAEVHAYMIRGGSTPDGVTPAPMPAPAPVDPGRPTLRNPAKGPAVTLAQQRLNVHGFPVTVDGAFGPPVR